MPTGTMRSRSGPRCDGAMRDFDCVALRMGAIKIAPQASVAQLVEQKTLNLLVLGSNPSRGTFSLWVYSLCGW